LKNFRRRIETVPQTRRW